MVAGMIGPRARLLIRETRHGREREREIRKHKENKQQRREHIHAPLHESAWKSVSLFLSSRGDEFPFSAGTIFICGEPRGREKRVHECTRKQRAIVFFQRLRRLFGLCAGDVYLAMQRALAMSYASKYSVRDTPS